MVIRGYRVLCKKVHTADTILKTNWALNWAYPKKGFGPIESSLFDLFVSIFPFPLDPVYLPRVLYVLILEYLSDVRDGVMVIHSGGLRPSMKLIRENI